MEHLKTPFARHPWLVMLVGIPEDVATRCMQAIAPTPVRRVASVGAALETIVERKPLLVVVGPSVTGSERAAIRAVAEDERATVFEIGKADDQLAERLRAALTEAESGRAAESGRWPAGARTEEQSSEAPLTPPARALLTTLLLVGLSDEDALACQTAFAGAAIVARVAHVPAALQRMLVLKPRVIIVGAEVVREIDDELRARAQDIGAVLVAESVQGRLLVELVRVALASAASQR